MLEYYGQVSNGDENVLRGVGTIVVELCWMDGCRQGYWGRSELGWEPNATCSAGNMRCGKCKCAVENRQWRDIVVGHLEDVRVSEANSPT